MKKLLAICLSVLLLCASMPFAFATAADDPYIRIEAGTAEGKAGETVSVEVYAKDNPGIISARVRIVFNSDVFELTACEKGDFTSKGYSFTDKVDGLYPNPFVINWCDNSLDEDATSELLATLTFQIKDDAAAGVYPLEVVIIDSEDFYNVAYDYFTVDSTNGSITVIGDEPVVPDCTHEYDAACDPECNLCGAIRPVHTEGIVHTEAKAATCFENGNIEYWYCPECECFWADEALTQLTNSKNIVLPMGHNDLTHVAAKDATCFENGNIEYWTCEACGYAWLDAEGTLNTNLLAVILPAAHNVIAFEAKAPGCHYEGNIAYWFCTECELCWQDEALTQQTNLKNVILPEIGGELTHVEAKDPTCFENGNIEHWFCPECEQFWQDEAMTQLTNSKNVILPMGHNELTHVAAKDATCFENGNIEYWTCEACGYAWLDAEGTLNTNLLAVVLPAAHTIVAHEAVEAGCHYNGNIAYWFCTACELCWQDEALTQQTNLKNVIIPAIGGEVVAFEAIEPGCHMNGRIAYWFCPECEQFWQDEALTQLTNSKNVILPMAHGELTHVEAVAPTCFENGNIEYWTCEACGYAWLDAEGTLNTNLLAVVLPAAHTIVAHEAVEAGCHYNGNIAYWFCTACELCWQDEALTQQTNLKNVIIPAIGGEVVAFEAIEPGCHMNGRIAYWFCPECEQFWQDEALTQLTNSKNVILPATGSENLKHVEYKAPTATENGNIEYWYCPDCEQFWQDEALTQLTNSKNVIIPATGEVEEPDSPVTGDSIVAVLVALLTLVVSGVAVVLLKNKKRA